MKGAELERCQALLAEGYGFWTSLGREPLSQAQREEIPRLVLERLEGEKGADLAAACQSFLLFRRLHQVAGEGDAAAILLGVYFFGLFSQCLIPLDSPWLIEQFAAFLREDAEEGVRGERGFDLERYRQFVKALSGRLAVC